MTKERAKELLDLYQKYEITTGCPFSYLVAREMTKEELEPWYDLVCSGAAISLEDYLRRVVEDA